MVIGSSSAQSPAVSKPPMQWSAQWIAAQPDSGMAQPTFSQSSGGSHPLPIFRHSFLVSKKMASASLNISGLGQFETRINGRNVTEAVLVPAWSDYRKRVFYETYDVTPLLRTGENVIGVMLGNGMYNVEKTNGRYTKFVGSFGEPKLIAQLHLRFSDGTEQVIASDGTWKTSPGPITFSSTYGGEDYDARLEPEGWDTPGFDDDGWAHAATVQGPGGRLDPETVPAIKLFDHYEPVKVTHPRPGTSIYDLGQNFAGWPEIEVSGQRGSSVKLIAGELLDGNGLVTQRSANAFPESENSFTYVLKGEGLERWHPRFSYYGFRYVQVQETGAELPVIHHLEGRFLHDEVNANGHFTSSDQLLNRIHTLINRAMLSNMVSVLTDCPHREKLGWLEQTHLAGTSLMYNYDLSALYTKMADDMEDAQLANGLVPDIAPEFTAFEDGFRDSPEWGAAVILSPWTAYQFYGDLDSLRNHYDSMAQYLAYLKGRAQGYLLMYGLGDWYDIGPGAPGISQLTGPGLTSTAIYYQALTTMSRIAALLRKTSDASKYASEANEVKQAFNARFFHSDTNQYDSGSQTANALPLVVGLVPEEHRDAVVANLVADIRSHNNHVTAGDVGFHYLVRALTEAERSDVLYDMLSRTDKPSYGDQLAHGATTLTEAWDADPASSQNHFMLGHAEEWFYRGLAGIDFDLARDEDSRIMIRPAIVGNVESAEATFQSKLGRIESGWLCGGGVLRMNVTIPHGAKATVLLPSGYRKSITVNGHALKEGRNFHIKNDSAFVVTGGTYHFEARQ
jgi:alpha-L-rhamnosidase